MQFRVARERAYALKSDDLGYKLPVCTISDITLGKLLNTFEFVSLSVNQGFFYLLHRVI